MKLRYLAIALVLLFVLLILFWPKSYLSKEEFVLRLGEMTDDISVLSVGFSHVYHLQMPNGYDTACFERMNVTLLQNGEVYSVEIPALLAQERFCSNHGIPIVMTNRGDYVEVQKA